MIRIQIKLIMKYEKYNKLNIQTTFRNIRNLNNATEQLKHIIKG
jgi:hypothetical protein